MLGLTASVILRGASGGIEKATRILIPLLFILLVVVCIRSLTLPNAMEGLKFLFMPDFSRIDGSVVLMAMGLAFLQNVHRVRLHDHILGAISGRIRMCRSLPSA